MSHPVGIAIVVGLLSACLTFLNGERRISKAATFFAACYLGLLAAMFVAAAVGSALHEFMLGQ